LTKIITRLGLAAMALSIANAAIALPAVQSAHFRRHAPIRTLETWRGRRHQPLVHGVRRSEAHSGLPTGKRMR
jgi:hypothetical protein